MTNYDRLVIEIGSDTSSAFASGTLITFMQETGGFTATSATATYNPTNKTDTRNILKAGLIVLETFANDINLMKNYKSEDITITQFSENLQNRIDQFDRKIRLLPDTDDVYTDGASFSYMFNDFVATGSL